MVESQHVQPRRIDDAFSSDLFNLFISSLDPSSLYFTKDDIRSLDKFHLNLDDEINNSKADFFNEVVKLYKSKLTAAEARVNKICATPFTFTADEYFDFGSDTIRASSEKQLNDKWYLLLKEQVMEGLIDMGRSRLAAGRSFTTSEVLQKEPQFRERIKNQNTNKIKALLKSDAELTSSAESVYLNAFLGCMDPHSSYMNAAQKQDFESHLNTEGYYFGFSIGNTPKGEVAIMALEPGGPAWVSGMINKDDVLLSMKWASKEATDLTGLDAETISDMLDESNTEKLELTVRKKSGEVQTVTLQKRKLESDENIVKSFELNGEKKVGYIVLPAFYTRWEDASGSSCAADVAKEIIKLKKDSISGLILDLRYNGGGSLQEAVEMAGIFIDEGAICQVGSRTDKILVLKDINRGVIYSGPMVVLVNGYSASASELLAGSLQDYNRALIVGSRTHGKATGQQIRPVENMLDPSDKSFVKLTCLKLYRVTGKSIQRQGVQPDIELPDPYESFGEHESDNPYALKPDTVSAYKYFHPMKPLVTTGLKQQSATRVMNKKFKALGEYAEMMTQEYRKGKMSLKWDLAEKQLRQAAGSEQEKLLISQGTIFYPANNRADLKFINVTDIAREINRQWLQRIGQDPYIEESFSILMDLIKLN